MANSTAFTQAVVGIIFGKDNKIMPVHFDWRSLQQYALPALGIVSLLVSAIIAVAGGLGLGGSSSENDNADANVVFKVVDRTGCHVFARLFRQGICNWIGYISIKQTGLCL